MVNENTTAGFKLKATRPEKDDHHPERQPDNGERGCPETAFFEFARPLLWCPNRARTTRSLSTIDAEAQFARHNDLSLKRAGVDPPLPVWEGYS